MTKWVDMVRSVTRALKIFPSPQTTNRRRQGRKENIKKRTKQLKKQNMFLSGSLTGQLRDSLQ
jgi:hypothetical protein